MATHIPESKAHRDSLPQGLLVSGVLWTLPNSVLGLLLRLAGLAFGARLRWQPRKLALVVRRWPWARGGAPTLGNVIVHTGERLDVPCLTYAHRAGRGIGPPVSLADHERAHVCQHMLLGPLFLPLYLLCGGVRVRNPFERGRPLYALGAWLVAVIAGRSVGRLHDQAAVCTQRLRKIRLP